MAAKEIADMFGRASHYVTSVALYIMRAVWRHLTTRRGIEAAPRPQPGCAGDPPRSASRAKNGAQFFVQK
ncbi:hypothetical protein E2C01_098135 [Portunus trituberculatus]|uniref:Uncharacterized protein n=1 Tax=Portunus trituberculatus TaxID=210409 RepID=A0A5B7K6V5_PORTR|nr:hypothetical protein [Portunus trituberculatus]